MKNQRGFTSIQLLFVIVWVAGLIGWISNIVKIADSDFAVMTGMLVARIIGVFVAPLGAVLGWL